MFKKIAGTTNLDSLYPTFTFFKRFRSKTLKTVPCSGAHTRQGQIRECPPPFREIPTEQRILHAVYVIYPLERKKGALPAKLKRNTKTKNIFLFDQRQYIKVKENKTRIKLVNFISDTPQTR